jgi:rod shape-determining protein MreC
VARTARGGTRLDAALLVACLLLAGLALILPGTTREAAAALLRGTVLRPLVDLERRATAARGAILGRDALLAARGATAVAGLDAAGLAEENAELRRLLGLATRLRRGFVVAEVLPAAGAGDPFLLRLGAGRAGGVERFAPVVTADGLAGLVTDVDPGSSVAISWAHPDFRVSAMSVDGSAQGIVQPHLADGPARWLLELRGVPFRSPLDSGALIVSSGLGTTYPRGIPIGTVIGELSTTEKWVRTYLLRPAALGAAVGPVLVLQPTRVAGSVSGVWTSVAAADSAVRRIVAAGDSISRAAALAELAARRARLDSLRVDSIARDTVRRDTVRRDTAGAEPRR